MSIYCEATSGERMALARARIASVEAGTPSVPFDRDAPENEVPKCAAFFDHEELCDLPVSHLCGPSELALAMGSMFAMNHDDHDHSLCIQKDYPNPRYRL